MSVIQITNLHKSFNNKLILKDISLTIQKGEIFGLVGPDGAGKTTFIRTILGLYEPDNGKINILNTDNPILIRPKLGYVTQQFSLNTDMTVWENISLFASLQEIPTDVFEQRAHDLLEMVWLLDFKDRLAGNLSGGMKQKLALITSIIHQPEILILDEPTTGVDPVSRREFWQMLYRLNDDGLTILVSTPYMDEVELCNRLAFFHNGKIVAIGSPNELLATYPNTIFSIKSPNLKSILSKMSQIKGENVYLQGESLNISLPENQLDNLNQSLAKIGLTNYTIEPTNPSLEDLFSLLSQEGNES